MKQSRSCVRTDLHAQFRPFYVFADVVHADPERMATATTVQIGCSARERADAAMFAADPGEKLAVDPIGGDIVVAFDDRDRSGFERQRDQMTARKVRELRA